MDVPISTATTPSWDTRQLVALLAVVDTGTFSAAALQLGYTQSAVSQQIASLERAVGSPLFERRGGPRHVRRTPIGEALLVHARAVVARLNAAQADIAAIRAGERGTLRVGTLQSVGTKVLPRCFGASGRSSRHRPATAGDLPDQRADRGRRVGCLRPVLHAAAGARRTVRRTPRARRPLRVPFAGRRPGGPAELRDACTRWSRCPSSGCGTSTCASRSTPTSAARAPSRSSSSAPTTTRRSRALWRPASATPSCRASPSTRTTRRSPSCASPHPCRRAASASAGTSTGSSRRRCTGSSTLQRRSATSSAWPGRQR